MTDPCRRSEQDSEPAIFKAIERSGMEPCPKCGRTVKSYVGGGYAAFGCGEFGFEVECACGISFYFDRASNDTPEAALIEGIAAWNDRAGAEA